MAVFETVSMVVIVSTDRQAVQAIQRGISLMEEGRYDTETNARIILNELLKGEGRHST